MTFAMPWRRFVAGSLVEDRSDMLDRIVTRQIKLDRHAFPVRVGMNANAVARHVARQDRNRIHTDLAAVQAEVAL